MKKQIILLNGPSSAGKSTLSKALQAYISEKQQETFGIVSIDDFLKVPQGENIYEDDVYEISADICHRANEMLQIMPGVIVDHVITSQRIFAQFQDMLSAYAICPVHVSCPLDVLLEREKQRGDRRPGTARASFDCLYPKDGYHVTVNTHEADIRESAERIYNALF